MKYGLENGVMVEPAEVIFHLPEGLTKILFVRTYGLGLADGGAYWDVPTELIPTQLRAIGSRFVIRVCTQEQRGRFGRYALHDNLEVLELPREDRNLWPTNKNG
ncbi:MAG TPA: hypothetical protein VKP58_09515 [Candidatus Acidoferrum sp.]|nr:hypothetical protein [Candidatus Acidoferrum sp.]